MLATQKMPTVVSFHQEDDPDPCPTSASDGSGSVAALAGARMPLILFPPFASPSLRPHVEAPASTVPPASSAAELVYDRASAGGSSSSSDSFTSSSATTPLPDCNSASASSSDDGCADHCSAFASAASRAVRSHALSSPQSVLERTLLSHWRKCAERGLFKYDVTSCESSVLNGRLGFVAQLNEGRATTKRPTEFRVDLVCQPFDNCKFNFCKAPQSEVLFSFMPSSPDVSPSDSPHSNRDSSESGDDNYPRDISLSSGHGDRCVYYPGAYVGKSPSLVLINISPIEYGHVLLVPRALDKLPQRIRQDALAVALHLAHECANPHFKVGYNSLGAYATINHLHFQAYFLETSLPLENAQTERIKKLKNGVTVLRTTSYPVRSFVFEASVSIDELANAVSTCCEALQQLNMPFNLLISDMGARVFVIPNCFAERIAMGAVPERIVATGINPAVFEISGHLLYKRRQDYEVADEAFALDMLSWASLSKDGFQSLASQGVV